MLEHVLPILEYVRLDITVIALHDCPASLGNIIILVPHHYLASMKSR